MKKIQEIQIKYNMCVEDRKSDKIAFEKRVNQLIRDFVKIYKSLAGEFKNYKEYVNFEMEILKKCLEKKQEVIDANVDLVKEYQMALRIPRLHYKHLEQLKYEEMIEQRDQIIKKMKKKGIDYS